MKCSKATDYALHALLYMIKSDGESRRIPVQDLATILKVSTTYLSKILTRLVKVGIISASSGAKGGYQLKNGWEHVSIYDVIITIDGKQSLLEDSFNHAKECPIKQIMDEAEHSLITNLEDKTLKDLANS
ncbi:RrF2 family transcriptional regulator [Staphylococcus shinii]|uniref:Rrf2 family transcriptional regulator n=1 Tax=Staphylococcus shinii TaxID=2912228 RepID=A0A418IHB9_9STAP|nr:Rrf2 family transcriptional regulator [Staphylococcus shinii]MDW8564854.1 Rrf2 family transcriptional regulator [Staphylococcus shinii]MDW8568092.1 Rrf2 family transcriptional regulator [Staphylococcus shinii]RIN01874.1 Rrf2 family transcriptional regulator [Staphylococcus shinii]RIN08131.1 Rrf2 family transcriptional regulator [Staphylococcus shinii]